MGQVRKTWTQGTLQVIPSRRTGHAGTIDANGRLYIHGGRAESTFDTRILQYGNANNIERFTKLVAVNITETESTTVLSTTRELSVAPETSLTSEGKFQWSVTSCSCSSQVQHRISKLPHNPCCHWRRSCSAFDSWNCGEPPVSSYGVRSSSVFALQRGRTAKYTHQLRWKVQNTSQFSPRWIQITHRVQIPKTRTERGTLTLPKSRLGKCLCCTCDCLGKSSAEEVWRMQLLTRSFWGCVQR